MPQAMTFHKVDSPDLRNHREKTQPNLTQRSESYHWGVSKNLIATASPHHLKETHCSSNRPHTSSKINCSRKSYIQIRSLLMTERNQMLHKNRKILLTFIHRCFFHLKVLYRFLAFIKCNSIRFYTCTLFLPLESLRPLSSFLYLQRRACT